MRGKRAKLAIIFMAAAAVFAGGCSRSVLNYQIAECIGTLDKYENNEPVETPKMKAERERLESEASLNEHKEQIFAQAASLALSYRYEEAIALLQNSEEMQDDERAAEAVADYQKQIDGMYSYDGDIVHLCFTNLVTDTSRAFDGDEYAKIYQENMITLTEFTNILTTLYESGYILVDIQSLAEETEGTGGDVTMSKKLPVIPQGKKPFVLSIDNLNYSSIRNGDGVATRLALDKEGNVGALYTDAEGHDLIGAYDVVPVVEQFIAEHPDFSYQDARGIISVSAVEGVFGYQIEEGKSLDYEGNVQTVRQIAQKLAEDGWRFACAGYDYVFLNTMSYDELRDDITKWKSTAGSVLGDCDILFYPYGAEVDYTSEKGAYVIHQGFRYHIGLWAEGDHLEVNSTYLRQTRRTVTGYMLENYPGNFSTFFSVNGILDSAR